MTLRVLAEAEEETREAARWYEAQRAGLGDRFLAAVGQAFQAIEAQPRAFSGVATSRPGREVRRFVLPRFPYSIFYEVRADEVLVLAVAHARRRPYYWLTRNG